LTSPPLPDAPAPDVRTCYRHPDRETGISCTRCERPICPDCMREAAVGFQCPECVREGSRSIREARTVFGGRVGAEGTVTRVLIGICVVAYVLQNVDNDVTRRFADIGVGLDQTGLIGVAAGEYYRMITSAFLHASLIHIGFNMFALYTFGTVVERALGSGRFLAVYLLSAVGGSVASYLVSPVGVSVGASGAVFGMFGAYFMIARRLRIDTSQIVGLIAVNLVLGFVIPQIDNAAHVGGLVTGAAITLLLAQTARLKQRDLLHVVAVGAVLALLAGLTVAKTRDLRDQGLIEVFRQAAIAATTSETGTPSR
jgi:membrane associated rhomboid family serine protease